MIVIGPTARSNIHQTLVVHWTSMVKVCVASGTQRSDMERLEDQVPVYT